VEYAPETQWRVPRNAVPLRESIEVIYDDSRLQADALERFLEGWKQAEGLTRDDRVSVQQVGETVKKLKEFVFDMVILFVTFLLMVFMAKAAFLLAG
jgi:hypothetical protein